MNSLRRLLALLLAAVALAPVASGQPTAKNRATLYSDIDTALPSSTGAITAAVLRAQLKNIVASANNTINADAQPADADLTAIAALAGTNTIYYRSAANTWTAVAIGTNLTFSGGTLSATGGGLLAANNLSDLANAATARTNLGLGSVNNTADSAKPVSTATQTALNLKANTATTLAGYGITDGTRVLTVTVANDTARFALTATQAPNGAVVTVTATGLKYLVVNSASLASSAGYSVLNPTGDSQIQLRRGTTAELDAITPADGEPVWDTTLDKLRIGNGVVAGGVQHDIAPATTLHNFEDGVLPVVRGVKTLAGNRLQFNSEGIGFANADAASGEYPASIAMSSGIVYFMGQTVGGNASAAILQIPSDGTILEYLSIPQQDTLYSDDETFNTTTLAVTTVGGPNIYSNRPVEFEYDLHITASAAGGFKLSISSLAPPTITYLIASVEIRTVASPSVITEARITALNSPVTYSAGATSLHVIVRGVVRTSTAGGISLFFAQNVASGTTTIKQGSRLKTRFMN
jgi:hypothetical protein